MIPLKRIVIGYTTEIIVFPEKYNVAPIQKNTEIIVDTTHSIAFDGSKHFYINKNEYIKDDSYVSCA